MEEKDVILTVYSCSGSAPCSSWAKQFFKEEPLVINVPGQGGSDFRTRARAWGKTGDLFQAAVNQLAPQYKNIKIRRRAVVTFSVGWSFMDEVFKFSAEIDRLNAYILLDGCHTEDLKHWYPFAIRAANLESFMVMAHTEIKPPFVSTSVTNKKMFVEGCKFNEITTTAPKLETSPPDYVTNYILPAGGITITVAAVKDKEGKVIAPAVSRHWDKDPLVKWENRGGLTKLHYSGNDKPDHVYIAQHVNKNLWHWLGDEWNVY